MISSTLLKRPHSLVANWYIKKFGVTIALLSKIIFVNPKLVACIKTQTQVLPLVQKALQIHSYIIKQANYIQVEQPNL